MPMRPQLAIALGILALGACSGSPEIMVPDCGAGGAAPCGTPGPGSVAGTITTIGNTPDLDGYDVVLDGDRIIHIDINGTVRWDSLEAGTHTLAFNGVAPHCAVTGGALRTLTVEAEQELNLDLEVRCATNLRGWIAYAHNITGRYEIWAARPNGEMAFRVVEARDWQQYFWPSISPDGSKIAYVSNEDDNNRRVLWVADADGENPVAYTDPVPTISSSVAFPEWSPDGSKLLYSEVRRRLTNGTGQAEIIVAERDGSSSVIVAPVDTTIRSTRLSPRWSPDGAYVVFVSDTSINRIGSDGSNEQVILRTSGYSVDWSAKDRLVFTSLDGGTQRAFSMTVNGDDVVPLTPTGENIYSLTFDPTGDRILYARGTELYVMNSDGSGKQPVITSGSSSWPSWR